MVANEIASDSLLMKHKFKYQIYPANNGPLVRRVMEQGCPLRNQLWIEAPNMTQSHFHFRWAPTSRMICFDRFSQNFQQAVNHLEGHTELTRKNELYKNIRHHLHASGSAQKLFALLPVQFHIKVQLDPKQEKVSKKELKASLQQFKQVFKLLEGFKTADPSTLPLSAGLRDRIFVSEKGQSLSYSTQTRTIKKPLKQEKPLIQSLIYNPTAEKPETANQDQRPCKVVAVKNFEEADSPSELQMPLCHFGVKAEDGKGFTQGGQNLWILKPIGLNRGQGIHVVNSIKMA